VRTPSPPLEHTDPDVILWAIEEGAVTTSAEILEEP
jgi:hypothetical protein